LPPTIPLTCHVTAVLGEPLTEAVNCCVPKFATVAALGVTVTEVDDEPVVTVTVAEADFEVSACDVAVTVTCGGFGTAAGAVYNPPVEMVPLEAAPTTLQVTAVFVVPEVVAVNCCVLPTLTFAAVGPTETVIGAGGGG
jgi:hypothetical protein